METYYLTTWQYLSVLEQFTYAWGKHTRTVFDGEMARQRFARAYQMAAIFAGK